MFKKILLFTITSGIGYLAFSSYTSGAASGLLNRSGAKGSSTTCGGGGCHGTGTSTTVSIVVDSAGGVAVTRYRPGVSYTVVVTGHNTSSLPQFGYQFASVSGTGSSQVQAGTSTAPASSRISPLSGINFVEQSTQIAGTAGNYTVSIPWTAPTAGTGTITMYCTLNAVDGDGNNNSADISGNTNITLNEGFVSVPQLSKNIDIKTYPNPATNQFSIKIDGGTGIYNVNFYDMSGRIVCSENISATGMVSETIVNCANWPKGYYGVQISQNGAQRVLPVVKI
jgi:hypothetical protein